MVRLWTGKEKTEEHGYGKQCLVLCVMTPCLCFSQYTVASLHSGTPCNGVCRLSFTLQTANENDVGLEITLIKNAFYLCTSTPHYLILIDSGRSTLCRYMSSSAFLFIQSKSLRCQLYCVCTQGRQKINVSPRLCI